MGIAFTGVRHAIHDEWTYAQIKLHQERQFLANVKLLSTRFNPPLSIPICIS